MVLCSSTILFVALGLRLRPVSASVREECLLTAVAWVVPEDLPRLSSISVWFRRVLSLVGFVVKHGVSSEVFGFRKWVACLLGVVGLVSSMLESKDVSSVLGCNVRVVVCSSGGAHFGLMSWVFPPYVWIFVVYGRGSSLSSWGFRSLVACRMARLYLLSDWARLFPFCRVLTDLRVPLLVVGSLRLLVLSFGGRGSFDKVGVVVLVKGSGCLALFCSSGSSQSLAFFLS
ncbi:hypothetical protein Bca4012_082881 [Brassica carinata]